MKINHKVTASLVLSFAVFRFGVADAAPILLQQPTATFSQTGFGGFPVGAAIDGNPATGWAIDPNEVAQTAVFETSTDIFTSGGTLTFTLDQLYGSFHTIGRFRLSATTDNRALFADGIPTGGDVTANWVVLDPGSFSSASGATLTELGDNSILAGGVNPNTDTYTVVATTTLASITGLRLEVLEDPSLPFNGPGRQPSNSNLVLTNFTVDATPSDVGPAPVPEPATGLLLASGLIATWATRQRKSA